MGVQPRWILAQWYSLLPFKLNLPAAVSSLVDGDQGAVFFGGGGAHVAGGGGGGGWPSGTAPVFSQQHAVTWPLWPIAAPHGASKGPGICVLSRRHTLIPKWIYSVGVVYKSLTGLDV